MNLAELRELADKELRSRKPVSIRCCSATGCLANQSKEVLQSLEASVEAMGLGDHVDVCAVGCMGLCGEGTLVRVETEHGPTLYGHVDVEDALSIVTAMEDGEAHAERIDLNSPFFTHQLPIVRENAGRVEPERIESYIALGGYEALYRVLHEMTPAEVVDEIARSGLRGRGGAGYPTGLKWSLVAKSAGPRKFIICNADEGDPGAFMDRDVLESDPHRVLEGMAIAGYAVGANQGYIYVRGEYPLAISRLQTALRHARRHGLLGTQIFESNFDFRIDIRIGAGAFVCGEETALMASIEGRRGTPRTRPPYPAEHGLWGCPTIINNVETFANIAPIINRGADWFASIGTGKSKGTKVFALAGQARNIGLIEVPMGMSLGEIVNDIGGGSTDGTPVKAVQTGGPSGGCIPASAFNTSVDYESLAAIGSIMGSGGMIVMDQSTNMVDVARFFMDFCADESCGKCIPCRVGTTQIHGLLVKIGRGEATMADLARLEELCEMVRRTSLCGLGQNAPNPVLTTLRYFRDEYLALIQSPDGQPRLELA